MLSGYTVTTEAMDPKSNAGNQIITLEDYTTKQIGQTTTVTISGDVPSTGMVYVTLHLDYVLKKSINWTQKTGTDTIPDAFNQTGFESGSVTIEGVQPYTFSRTVGSDASTVLPESYNEFKKNPGVGGSTIKKLEGSAATGLRVELWGPTGKLVGYAVTDADGVYQIIYKHTGKAATFTVKVPSLKLQQTVTLKANGFGVVNFFDLP
jgi:hypothetical protein